MSEASTQVNIVDESLANQEFFQFAYDTIRECIKEAYRLQAREEFVEREKVILHQSISEAMSFKNEKPEYLHYLENLQTALYQQNLQVFQQLLTYFIQDVLQSDKEISMTLSLHRNMPALNIEAVNEGFKESIIDGSGGAVANIISTGLRLICLSRLAHRKFIILDEPDCWIKPEFVPAFARIIGELSRKLRIQTVIISHHEWSVFKDYGRVIELDKDGAILQTKIAHDTSFNPDEVNYDYIKKVSLRRFMSHYNTTYELHPFLTCIIGKNDLGKSVIGAAIKALAFNSSKDSYVKHNEKSAQVYIETSVGDGFLWERYLEKEKGQEQKVKYSLFKDEKLISSEFNSNKTPDFINEKLKIMKTEGIDVHISNQKTPIFMIDDNTTQQDRAKILSLGKELIVIQKMMEHINKKGLEYSRQRKKDEILYAQYVTELKLLNGIGDKITELEELKERVEELKESIDDENFLNLFLPELKKLKDLSNIRKIEENLVMPTFEDETFLNELLWEIDVGKKYSEIKQLDSLPPIPTFADEVEISILINNLHHLMKAKDIAPIKSLVNPTFHDNTEIKMIINGLSSIQKLSKMNAIESIVMPDIEDEDLINQLLFDLDSDLVAITEITEKLNQAQELQKTVETAKQDLDLRIAEYHKSVGNICPTCKQKVSFEIYKEHIL